MRSYEREGEDRAGERGERAEYEKKGKGEGQSLRADGLCGAAEGADLSFVGAFRHQRAGGVGAVRVCVAHRARSARRGGRVFRSAGQACGVWLVGGRQRAPVHAGLFCGAHVFARCGVPCGGQPAQADDAAHRVAARRGHERSRQRQGEPHRKRKQGAGF